MEEEIASIKALFFNVPATIQYIYLTVWTSGVHGSTAQKALW